MNFLLKCEIIKKGMAIKMTLEDTIIRQEKIKNPNYSTILFGDINTKGKILDIEFIINPNFERSDMKFTMKAERGIYIICDLYILQYIQYKVMKVLSTSINFMEIANYAKDSVGQYIQMEYANKFLKGNYQHTNIYLDIVFNSPVIILPLNIFDNENTDCIKLSLGKFKGLSNLPPRKKPEIDYSKIKEKSLLFDEYKFDIQGAIISTVKNCTLKNGFAGTDTMLLEKFDMSVICNILIETKNFFFPNIEIIIKIPIFDFQIDEFQILFLIDYLGNMNKGNNKLAQETAKDINQQNTEKEEIENFMKRKSNIPIVSIEDENIKFMKKRVEEFDQKIKEKEAEKRYNQFVKSYSIIFKKNKLLNAYDIVENSKKTLYILLEFNEVKFIIKKNYTDFTVEEFLVYDQKLLKIEYFIIETGYMMVKLDIKDIGLFDKDKEEKEDNYSEENIINTESNKKKLKKYLIDKKFLSLIKSSSETLAENKEKENNLELERTQKEGFIVITYLYRVELEDTSINIIMNNLNIIISFESLKRIYQFSMYYLDKYHQMVEDTNLLNNNPNNISPDNKKDYIKEIKDRNKSLNKEKMTKSFANGINSDLKKQLEAYIEKVKTTKKDIVEDSLNKWRNLVKSDKMIRKETIKNNLRVKFTMKNTIFKVPLYPQDSDTPLVEFFFNMIYNQEWNNKYENIYTLPNKKILETNYIIQDSKMNLIVNKLNLDVNFPSEKRMFIMKRKILNDLRVFIEVSMSIIPKLKQSLIITDIVLEPLLINLTVKQFVYLMEFYSQSMKFLNYDMAEKYIPLMKPEYLTYGIPKKRKMTFKECFKRIVLAKKLRKKLKNDLKILKKQKGEKIENINTASFNSYIECNVKIDQIGFTFFDTNTFRRISLFKSDFSKLSVKFISNNKCKDKKNMGNAILEMIAASELPIEEYNLNNLGMYLDVFCTFEANYHNTGLSEYEPLIERIKIKVLMYQVASFMRNK